MTQEYHRTETRTENNRETNLSRGRFLRRKFQNESTKVKVLGKGLPWSVLSAREMNTDLVRRRDSGSTTL